MTKITLTPLSTIELVDNNNRNIQLAIIEKIKSLPRIEINLKFISNSEVYLKPLPKVITNVCKN